MTLQKICAPFLACFLIAPLTNAAETPPNLGANAALQYWPAFELLPQNEGEPEIIQHWEHAPLDEAAAKIIQDGRQSLVFLHAGAKISQCDWGLDFTQGVDLLLPHLNKSRMLTNLACLRTRYEFQQHQLAAAVDDACDVFICARHVARDPILISMLVQFGMERSAIDALAANLNQLDAASMKHLSERLDQLPPSGTLADAIKAESDLSVNWAIQRVKNAGPNPNWAQVFSFVQSGNEGKDQNPSVDDLLKESGGSPAMVIQQLSELLSYYDEMGKLLSTPHSQEEFHEKSAELDSRYQSNSFGKLFLPSFSKAYDAQAAAQTRMLLLKSALAVLQHGEAAAKNLQDPVNHQPIEYEANPHGFVLTSKVIDRGKPVILIVGANE